MAKNSQVNVGIKFKSDSKEVENSLSKLKKSLQDLQKIKPANFLGTEEELKKIQGEISQVEKALNKAFNPTLNTTNLNTFYNELSKSGIQINKLSKDMAQLGPQGSSAFNRMATEVLTTNLQLKQTHSLIDSMGKTMINTVKWGIASSIMNTFTQSVQGAFQYVQSLEKSLTNIRIVTGDSTEKMAQFAEQANRSAQALGRSTLDYTKASLTFYQQGLNEEDVQARTEATLKAQNITGAGSQMADYLTSVWNGYKVANEEAELYVDKLAAVADSSASDMSQLAIAMSKVASTASTMGVDVDQLNAQIATVVATTRQAPESVGTAFKTIYTRMNDIKTGSDEAEISLGRYSGKMAELGFNVLDATGHLRDTGQVMEEIGGRWQDLTREQQVYLAQTMGGQRQVNQLMALFDNWTTYSELLNTSLESEGTLAEKNSRYMESLGAKMEQLGAAGERVKDALINEDQLKGGVDILTNFVTLMGNFIESIGGGSNALLTFGSIALNVFSGTIAKELNNIIVNFQNIHDRAAQLDQDFLNVQKFAEALGKGLGSQSQNDVISNLLERKNEIKDYYELMSNEQINLYNNLVKEEAEHLTIQKELEEKRDGIFKIEDAIRQVTESTGQAGKELREAFDVDNLQTTLGEAAANIKDLFYDEIRTLKTSGTGGIDELKTKFNQLLNVDEPTKFLLQNSAGFDKLQQSFNDSNITVKDLRENILAFYSQALEGIQNLDPAIRQSIIDKLKMAQFETENCKKKVEEFQKSIQQLSSVRTYTEMVAGLGQIASGVRNVVNLTKIWKNENLSLGQKILQTFTNASMTIGMLSNGITKVSKGFSLIQKGVQAYANATAVQIAAQKGLQVEYEITGIKAWASLGPYIAIAAAVAAAVGLIVLAYKEWNKEADAAKKASEVAADAKKAYDDLKTSLQDVKSALEDLHSAEDNLDGLTKGTQEWRDALQQCNDKVLELISNYPELAQYVTNENGQLKLSADGEQAYLDQLQAGVQNARNASYIASSNSREADAVAAAADIGHNSSYGTNTAGQGGGYASAEQVKTVVQAIDKVIGQGADLKGGLSGLTDKIADQTGQSKELVSAILSNEDAVLQLRTQLQQNETADKLMYETMAQGALANNSTFKGMDELGQQVASAIGGADLEKAIQDNQEEWMKVMRNDMSRLSNAATDSVSKVLDALNDAQGTNWKLDSNAVRGGINDRTLAFLDEQGKLHQFTAQQIASTIAAKQALQDLGASAETASKVLANIDTKISGNAQNAVKQWIAGQDITDINKSGLQELPKDLAQLFNEDELKSLAEARGIDTQNNKEWQTQLQQNWDNSLQDLSSSFDNVTKDASATVRAAFNSIKDDDTIKQATLGTQQEIVAQMQQTFTKGGSKALGQLTEFYSNLKDADSKDGLSALDAFSKATKDFDFNTGNVEDFKQALKEAGVETIASTQAIQAYINAQKQASGLSPEQNYKSVHDITDNLKRNDTIDAEQAATLEAAGVNVKEFFKLTADGSYKLKADAEVFQEYINGITIEPFKAKMDQLQNKIDSIHSFDEGGEFAKFSAQNMDIDQFSRVAGSITDVGFGDYQVNSQDPQKLQAQIEFLKAIGVEDAAIVQAQEAINKGQNTSAENLQRISELVKQHGDQYQDLSKLEKQYLEEITQTQEQIADASDRGLDSDVDEEKWENLSEHLQEYADQIGGVSAQLKNNAEAADDVAQAILRYDSAIGQVQKSYSDWLQALTSGSIEDQVQATEDLENVYSDLLDLPFENVLSADFLQNVDNLNLLKQAANGSEQAYNQLAQAAAKDILINCGITTDRFDADKAWIESQIANTDGTSFPDLEIGASIDDTDFIAGLQQIVNAAGMTADQATDYLASMGVDAEVIETDSQATETNQRTGFEAEERPVPLPYSIPVANGTQVQNITGQGSVSGVWYKPVDNTMEDVKENKAFSLKITSAKKSSGGGFKYRNASAGNKGGSGKGGGGKKGGGGGGGKAKEPNKAKGATNKADRYRNNTVKANKLANQMTKLQKQQEKLTGKDSLKNLQKQLQILKKQNETIRERIGLQRDEQKQLANNLKQSGATFDKDGTLNNYFKVHANIMKKYNDAVAKWNQMSAEQQQKNKEYLNNAKEEMDNALKDLQRYDKLQQEIAKSIQQQIDNAQEQIDLKAKQFELKIKAELNLSEAKRDWNKFRRDLIDEVRDDDILGLNKYRFADISSYFNNIGTGSIQYLTDRLKELTGTPDGSGIFSASYLNETLKNMTVTDRQARLEQIKKVMDDLQGQMEDFKSLADDIKKSIFDTIDATQDAFDQQMDEYEYIGDLINHNMKVTELLFGDQAYDKMAKYYDRIEENNNNQLDFLAKEKDLWYSRMMEEQARMAQLNPNTNAYKQAEDRFKQYQKHWMDSVNDLNGKIEDALDNIMDKYANAINNIFLNFDLSLGGGRALDDISDEWDMLNDVADTYLDKINSAYEIEKLQNAFDDAIDDNEGNIAAQQSLNNLMEQQLAYLKDKEKLTQYDVDRANTLLQIEMKRLALEQSRNNKNRLRLRRDSQGNYTYQYTADTEAMNKAEQELADARNSLYNSDKAAYVDNLSAIQKSANDIKDKLEDIWNDENLSKEQKLQKSYELQKYYGQKINDLIAENASIRNNLMDSAFEELAKMYNITPEQFRAMSKEQQDKIFKDIIPQSNSYAAQMVESIAGAGGFSSIFQSYLTPLIQAQDNKIASIAEIEEKSQTNFENIINDTDILIGQAEQLLDNNDKLVDTQEEQLNLLQSQLNVVSQMLQKYEEYKASISDAVKSGYNELNDANASIVGTTRAREDAVAAAQMKQLENGMDAASSAWDIKDYTPYTSQWSGSDFAALFGSANIVKTNLEDIHKNDNLSREEKDIVTSLITNYESLLSDLNMNDLFGTIDNNIFNSINNILNNILETNKEYYATSLAKQDAIRQAVVANQTVNINADFPNAKDVSNILQAIDNLTLVAAQRAGTTIRGGAGGSGGKSKRG